MNESSGICITLRGPLNDDVNHSLGWGFDEDVREFTGCLEFLSTFAG